MNYEHSPLPVGTIKEMRENIESLREEVRAERVAQGLPPEPPADFVPLAMGWTLFKKCEPLLKFAKEYAIVCRDSNTVIEISEESMEEIRSFSNYVELLQRVNDEGQSIYSSLVGSGISGLYNVLVKHREYESVYLLTKHIAMYLQFTCIESNSQYNREIALHEYADFHELGRKHGREKEEAAYNQVLDEVERLKDSDYFETELKKLIDHYESIKHLY